MCQALFLVADRPLPTIEKEESFTARYPFFGVHDRPSGDNVGDRVRGLLNHPYVYWLEAALSCGCGFHYVVGDDHGLDQDLLLQGAYGYAAVTSLGRYLADNIASGPIYLYASWSGDEGSNPIKQHHVVTTAWFDGPSFEQLADDSLYTIQATEPGL